MEHELVGFMHQRLRGLLPPEQYGSIMKRLMVAFGPYRQGGGGGTAAVTAGQLSQLRCMYTYVQATVDGGQPDDVVAALEALIKASS
jgi:hypothetical protein